MKITCLFCGVEWSSDTVLESEGLKHLCPPGVRRKVIEPDGKVWDITRDPDGTLTEVARCKECPHIFSTPVEENS